MGGMIAQQLTIDHPERVLSLCSIMSNTGNRRHGAVAPRLLPTMAVSMTTPRPEDPAEAERRGVEGFRLIAGPHFDADEITVMVRTALARNVNPLGTIRQLLAIQASPDRTPGLREVRVPTLVVHGLLDQLVMPSGGIATARAVPGSRLVMFPDMAHDLPGPRRAEIVEEIARNAARAARAADGSGRHPGTGRATCSGADPGWRSLRCSASAVLGERVGHRVDEEADLVLGDDERWGEADGRPLGLLGEDAARHQPLGQLAPARPAGLDVEPGPQPADADRPQPSPPAPTSGASRSARTWPRWAARRWKSPSASIVTTSWPMAAASGFPPNVEPCDPGVMTSRTSRSAAMAETG